MRRGGTKKPAEETAGKENSWHPQPDSNRCYQDENLMS